MAGAGVKILNKRIRSVGNTQKITKAMKMVAAAKLQRSQGKMLAARPFSQKLAELMQQLAGKADIVFDCCETGRTLAANDLVIVDEIMHSSTYMIANRRAWEEDPATRAEIEELRDKLAKVVS